MCIRDRTKAKAQEKLATFNVKIGYPDTWKDYSALDIKNDSYWANIERANEWGYAETVSYTHLDVYKRQDKCSVTVGLFGDETSSRRGGALHLSLIHI